MYCPKCFDNSLEVSEKGVLHIAVNGMHRDTGQVLYNLERDSKDDIFDNIIEKIDDFFVWYSHFTNKEIISNIQIYTSSFSCRNKCVLPATTQISVVGILVDSHKLENEILKLANKHHLEIADSNILK